MKKLLYILALLVSFSSFGQTEEIIRYYPNGAVRWKGNYDVNGNAQGKNTSYYKSGAVKSIRNYVDNILQGQWIFYYESGAVKSISNYVDDREHGESIEYYESGEIKEIGKYKEGYIIKEIEYYENGEIKEIRNYRNGWLIEN